MLGEETRESARHSVERLLMHYPSGLWEISPDVSVCVNIS